MALDFTFLTKEQIWGDAYGNGQLDVIEKYGKLVAPTDLTILLNGDMYDGNDNRTSEGETTCSYWSASPSEFECASYIKHEGIMARGTLMRRDISVRPILPSSETANLIPSNRKMGVNGIEIVEYGEYPQTVTDEETRERLERLYEYEDDSLRPTGKSYTFDAINPNEDYDAAFKARSCPEYELDGERYIRILVRSSNRYRPLSIREQVDEDGGPYWVKVQPIEWLADPTGVWVSKKCLFAGIPFDTKEKYDGNFQNTSLKKYLDTYFTKDIETHEMTQEREKQKMLKGLSEQLAEISDLEKVKVTLTPARTPERTEALARIMRVRKAKALLSKAAQKAHKEGDKKTLQEIVEMAKPYAAREAAVLNKFHLKRAERRAARSKKDRE